MTLCKLSYIGFFIIFITVVLFLIINRKRVDTFFSDILKDYDKFGNRDKWSQGRVYLLLSLIFYFFVITLLSLKAVKPNPNIKNDTFEIVLSALQWIIALFAGYVFGAKGLAVLDSILKYKFDSKGNYTSNSQNQNTTVNQSPVNDKNSSTNVSTQQNTTQNSNTKDPEV